MAVAEETEGSEELVEKGTAMVGVGEADGGAWGVVKEEVTEKEEGTEKEAREAGGMALASHCVELAHSCSSSRQDGDLGEDRE